MSDVSGLENKLLYFGYDPSCAASGLQKSVQNAVMSESIDCNNSELIDLGVDALLDSMRSELNNVDARTHVVPLSSGMDSRCILSALLSLDEIDADSIITITFGAPGTWDYEVGQKISDYFNIDNISINLTDSSFDWSEKSIRDYAHSLDCPTKIFQGYVNSKMKDYLGSRSAVWSGHFLDPSVGSHKPDDPSKSWNEARNHFLNCNQYAPELADSSFTPTATLPDQPYLSRTKLTYEEQLDFAHRQRCYIRPGVLGGPCSYLVPALQYDWLKYALNLKPALRTGEKIRVELISELCPKMLEFPTDMKHGLPPTVGPVRESLEVIKLKIFSYAGLHNPHPGTNYIDFKSFLRRDSELQTTVQSLVTSFCGRRENDFQHLWHEHQEGHDNTAELMAMASAEAYLSDRLS